jgi:hypothetical protein
MPCVFCSSSQHVLRDCDSQIGNNIYDDVVHLMTQNPFDIKYQATILISYTKPQLSFVCMKIHKKMTGTKAELVERIMSYFFTIKTNVIHWNVGPSFDVILNQIIAINLAYDYVYHWDIAPRDARLRHLLVLMIEGFYVRRNGFPRNGMSIGAYSEMLQYFGADYESNFIAMQQPHPDDEQLKPLEIQVTVDASLQVKECDICFEAMPHARLGCSHEYCVDCVFGSAKVRTKSFITCAMCRSEVSEVQVGSQLLKFNFEKNMATV